MSLTDVADMLLSQTACGRNQPVRFSDFSYLNDRFGEKRSFIRTRRQLPKLRQRLAHLWVM